MKMVIPRTMKARITLLTVSITLTITIIMASISFYIFRSFLEKNLIQTTEFSLQLVMDSIATDISELIYLSKWCGSNKSITDYLEAKADQEEYTKVKLEAFERLKEEFQNSKISEHIKRIVISDNEGDYIQIIGRAYDIYSSEPKEIMKLPFYNTLLESPTFTWIGIINDPLAKNYSEQVIPVIRPIYSSYNSSQIGWVYITVSKDIITKQFTNYTIPTDSDVIITIKDDSNPLEPIYSNYNIKNNSISSTQSTYKLVNELKGVTHNDRTTARIIKDKNNKTRTIVAYESFLDDWSLSQSISREHIKEQRQLYYLLIFVSCFVIVMLGTFLLLFLNRYINRPIKIIRSKINRISKGDFSIDPSIEWDNELGDIGKCINTLTYDIKNLMEKRIYDEKQKNELEYEILLSQINPHFLYNTLNSIKWMATIQNATGIAEMVTSLARLLKKVTKESNPFITIEEELSILEDYFIIQKYRYGGSITLEKNISKDLLDNFLPKFTLQPLIENAIFHGIEPKGEMGHIRINIISLDSHSILIEVRDDGIGMTEEQIKAILNGKEEGEHSFFRKIGISNVNRRIKYTFGESYGMSISSEQGEYTNISITLPKIIIDTVDNYRV